MKLLTRLRLGLSHFNEPRFSHNIKNGIIPLCTCGSEVEPRAHFFLHSHHFNVTQTILLINSEAIDKDTLKLSDNSRTNLLLFPESKFNNIQNYTTVILSITYILDSKRFDYFLIYCKALPFLVMSDRTFVSLSYSFWDSHFTFTNFYLLSFNLSFLWVECGVNLMHSFSM